MLCDSNVWLALVLSKHVHHTAVREWLETIDRPASILFCRATQQTFLRLLTNAEMDSHSPFAALLVGQPTLRRRIKLGTFAALDQRIALRYAMTGMTHQETASYLSHHLKLAGRSDTLFSDDATALIHQVSRGLPRAVNNLAIQALVAAYATNKAIVDESSARAAVAEVTAE